MPDIAQLIQEGSANLWLFVPTAIVLGALHGLEPGHSKTMMAAFIVAIQGTVRQAILLGLAATVSHTLVVWLVVAVGLYLFGGQFQAGSSEPYFQVASGALIIAIAVWMLYQTWRQQNAHSHDHSHSHDSARIIETNHGQLRLEILETGQPPRFRISSLQGWSSSSLEPELVKVETERPNGQRQSFIFLAKDGYLESAIDVPEPHEFRVLVTLKHEGKIQTHEVEFKEEAHSHGIDLGGDGEMIDAHELAHARDIQRRFAGNQSITTWQVVLFGLTGGLIPCPASITVLLLCLQLKQIPLGALLVLCFSIGLALTMVFSGVLAALSIKHVAKRWTGFGTFARRAPYFSSLVVIAIGLYIALNGLAAII